MSTIHQRAVTGRGGGRSQPDQQGDDAARTTLYGNEFKFMIWAGDGTPDTFHIRIWWEDNGAEVAVYDNGGDQPVGAGNIVIHTK